MNFSKAFSVGMVLIFLAAIPAFAGSAAKGRVPGSTKAHSKKPAVAKARKTAPQEAPRISSLEDENPSEFSELFFPEGMSPQN